MRAVVPAIRDLYRKAIHVVPVGVGRPLIVGCGAESKLSLFAYAEVPAVSSREPPGRHHGQVSLANGRIGRQKTLEVFRPVKSGRTGNLVQIIHRHRDFKVPVVPAVVSPHREGVYVVPVRVRRPLVVRGVPERQFAILIDAKVPAVRPRGAPPVYGSARTLRITARIPGQHLLRARFSVDERVSLPDTVGPSFTSVTLTMTATDPVCVPSLA